MSDRAGNHPTEFAPRDQWADESNTVRIEDYTVVDLRCGLRHAGQEIYAGLLNALDETYAPAGFVTVTASGDEIALFYPAPGRRLEFGIRFSFSSPP